MKFKVVDDVNGFTYEVDTRKMILYGESNDRRGEWSIRFDGENLEFYQGDKWHSLGEHYTEAYLKVLFHEETHKELLEIHDD